ncbi:MAG: oligosaccharide flippase family protein [Candidatus Hatepunaea meridiana]|nr:oligosaccharide flippase family protein [Candidatus Hatepunaea meridiana]
MTKSSKVSSIAFLKNALALASGTLIIQIIGFFSTPIISRLYTPEAFGIAALFGTVTSLVWPFLSFKYQYAIVLPNDDKEAANIFSLSIFLMIIMLSVIVFLITFFGESITKVFRINALLPYIWLLPLSMFFNGLSQPIRYWNIRHKYFRSIAVASVSCSVQNTMLKITSGIVGYNSGSTLIIVDLLGRALFTIVLSLKLLFNDLRFIISNISICVIIKLAKQYKDYPIYQNLSSLFNTASREIPTILLATYFGVAFVGQYSRGIILIGLPISLIAKSVGEVFFQGAAKRKKSGESLTDYTFTVFKRLIVFGITPFVFLFTIAPDFFYIFLGDQWVEAGRITQLLTPWFLMVFLSNPMSYLVLVFDKLKVWFYFDIFIFLARMIAILIGVHVIKHSLYTVLILSTVGTLCWIFAIIYFLSLVQVNIKLVIREFILQLAYSIPMVIFISAIKLAFNNPYITVFAGALFLAFQVSYYAMRDQVILSFLKEKIQERWINRLQNIFRLH